VPATATAPEALRIVQDGDARIRERIGLLSGREVARPGTLGDGGWGVRDLIGHLASWEERALQAFLCARSGEPFQALIGIRSVDALNERNVAAWRERSLKTVRANARAIHERLLDELRSCSAAEWRRLVSMSTGRRHRLATVVGSTLGGPDGPFTHADAHVPDLEAYLVALGRTEPGSGPPS
jgi:hypothetical protein